MASEWPTVRLGDHVDSSLGKMLDANKNKGTLAPYLGNSNVRWGQFDLADLAQMKFEPHETERYGIRDGDLIVCEGGEPGRCAIWREELPGMKIQKALHRVRPKDGLNNYYLFYWLTFAGRTGRLEPYFTGTTIKHLTGKALAELQIPLPPIAEQRAIAHILGALDDKIELNRRSNETLEAMARALFKSWFVDFDSVPAQGMQESELGLIPKGWRVTSLDAIADYLNGLALQKFPPESDAEFLPVIKIAQLRAGNTNGADKASARLKPEYIVENGDVLFSWSGSLEVEVWTGGRGALNQHLFKITSREVPKWFYYFATHQHLADFRAIAAGKATTMGHIQRGHLTAAKVAVPPPDAMAKHDAIIAPLFEQTINNALQARTLANLRDALLPRLISGQLRVKDAEKIVERAT
ncbi:polypeptide HsdS [Betaproteobacteria bacterium]|nr:polypeptide HsdS [Betaproteobacteria bacterium]GHU18796.1 polypeptide HsdS [Betaproteobacteria bacterium]